VFREAFSGNSFGFIAQEVEEVLPEVVNTDSDGYKTLDYGTMVSIGIGALKDNQLRIDSIYKRINLLEEILK